MNVRTYPGGRTDPGGIRTDPGGKVVKEPRIIRFVYMPEVPQATPPNVEGGLVVNTKLKFLLVVLGLLGLFLCRQASATVTVVYGLNDFNSGAGSIGTEWTGAMWHGSHSIVDPHIGDYFEGGSTTLTLTGLASHTQVALEFDLYLFNSWDGNNSTWGDDFFSLSGDVTFSETFTNHHSLNGLPDQTYPGVADVNPGFPGLSVTQIYLGLDPTGSGSEFLVGHTGSTFSVTFGGPTSQSDEQWGIDNVRVSIFSANVLEPTTLALLGLGLFGLGFNRRKSFQ